MVISSNIGSRGWLAITEFHWLLKMESLTKAGKMKLTCGLESHILTRKKQALALVLALPGSVRETAMEIPADDLNIETALFAKLDDLFLKEEKDRTYEAYSNYDRIMRDLKVSVVDYIVNFEQCYLSIMLNYLM